MCSRRINFRKQYFHIDIGVKTPLPGLGFRVRWGTGYEARALWREVFREGNGYKMGLYIVYTLYTVHILHTVYMYYTYDICVVLGPMCREQWPEGGRNRVGRGRGHRTVEHDPFTNSQLASHN